MFLILFRNILCPQQMFPSLRSMSNNVSSFASTLNCYDLDNSRSVTAFKPLKGLSTSQCRLVLMNNLLVLLFNYAWQPTFAH